MPAKQKYDRMVPSGTGLGAGRGVWGMRYLCLSLLPVIPGPYLRVLSGLCCVVTATNQTSVGGKESLLSGVFLKA